MKQLEDRLCFGGKQQVWSHTSMALNCEMKFGVFLPPQISEKKCPVLFWLSGLTCTEQNFITKAGSQMWAAKHGLIVVAPDTSPRGDFVANDDAYDLGQGAGFYINASQAPWASHFRMFDYITQELPALIDLQFSTTGNCGISGHSMGGHGALICALKSKDKYKSVSAFAPIVAPSQVPWGQKAFTNYLGTDQKLWQEWDSCELLASCGKNFEALIDQGSNDEFFHQLQPELLMDASRKYGHEIKLNMRAGYDHSYYFISSFLGEHFDYHAQRLL